jgi:hypothetical protein
LVSIPLSCFIGSQNKILPQQQKLAKIDQPVHVRWQAK